jgi:hypothetical protein
MLTRSGANRDIGLWGTVARAVVGVALIIVAIVSGVDALDILVGLGAFPLAVTAVVMVRGRPTRPIRFLGTAGHCINCALIVAAFVLFPEESLLFYGTSMFVAAARGYGGCELFALPNWLWRRDDQIACPLFYPVDLAERRALARRSVQ